MARYIDVDIAVREAINACNKLFRENGKFLTSIDAVDIADALDEIPAADVAEVKHGEWWRYGYKYECSICTAKINLDGTPIQNGMHYCPNCGAKMDGGKAV